MTATILLQYITSGLDYSLCVFLFLDKGYASMPVHVSYVDQLLFHLHSYEMHFIVGVVEKF